MRLTDEVTIAQCTLIGNHTLHMEYGTMFGDLVTLTRRAVSQR